MIKNMTRGLVEFEFEGKTAIIHGEAYLPGYGSPDFVAYENSITRWEPPHENEPFDDAIKKRLFAALVAAFHEKKWTIVVE